ncbi:hypothetical protein [Clostridium sartagoforme]|nr:hypothetical protein [Clostridium sartagoforme]
MNPNISVINENLWAVDFEYIKQGWVKDLSFNNPKPSDYMCFTHDGKIVINKNKPYHEDIIKYLKIIMRFKEEQLGTVQGFHFFLRIFIPKADNLTDEAFEKFVQSSQLDAVQKQFNDISNIEKNRRIIHAEYIKGIKKPTGIDKIKKIFKKKGVRK